MKRAAQRWIGATMAGASLLVAAAVASAADVTDADRTYRNFTRETAVVAEGQVRVEVRGLSLHDENNAKLNLLGFHVKHAQNVDGGIIDLVGSYGFAKNAELGFIVPGFIQSIDLKSGPRVSNEDVGDLLLYGKFKHSVAEHCWVGGGVQLTMPNGPESKGIGTGELGVNPVVSTRYHHGPFAFGANVAYEFYTGDVPDVFDYGAEVIIRGSETYAIRTELAGRVFHQDGTRWNDLTVLPGIDIKWSDTLTIRPTGLANGTNSALDWGVGLGVAGTF